MSLTNQSAATPGASRARRALSRTVGLLAGLLLAANALATPALLDWDTETWVPAGPTNLSETFALGQGTVTISFSGNTAGLNQSSNPSPGINMVNTGALMPAELSLHVATDYADNSNPEIIITLDFDHPGGISNLSFTAFDIDASGTFIDEIQMTGTSVVSGAINPTSIVTSVVNSQTSVNSVEGSSASASASSDGNTTFTFGQSGITQIVIEYRNLIGGTNPGFQWINIHDFGFDEVVADLSLDKTVDNASPAVGSNVVFTVQVDNAGADAVSGVEVTDALPAGYTYVSDNGGGDYSNATGIWDVGTVAALDSASLQITATVNATGPWDNTGEITDALGADTDSTPGNNVPSEDDQDLQVVTPALLGIAKAITAGPTNNGDGTYTLTYTVTAENAGLSTLNNLQLVDDISATFAGASGFVVDTVTSGDFAVNGAYNGVGNTSLLLGADSIAAGNSGSVDITVTVTPGAGLGPYNNSVTGNATSPTGSPVSDNSTSGTDPDPDNNGDPGDNAVPTPVSFIEAPEIGAAKAVTAGPTSNGNGTFTMTYQVTVENSGDVALNGVQVVEDLSTTFASATSFVVDSVVSGDFAVNGGFNGAANSNLLTGADSLATSASGTIDLTITVTPGANLGPYNNTATASGTSPGGSPASDDSTSGTDPDPDNNGDPGDNTVPTPVSFTEAPEIGAAKAVTAGPTSNGNGTFTLTYQVTVENSGDVALNGVQVVEDLSTTFASATSFVVDSVVSGDFAVNGGFNGAANSNLLTGADSLATSASGTIDLTITVTPGANLGPYNNTATASGTSPGGSPASDASTSGTDPDPDNNGDPGDNAVPTPVSFIEAPEIGAAKAVTAGPTSNGNGTFTLTYQVTVENSGDVALNGVQVVEDLSSTFAGATSFVVDSVVSGDFAVNGGFNGAANSNLLTGADSLATSASGTIDLTITVTPGANLGPYNNTATASGTSPGGSPASDDSTSGTDPDPDNNGDPGDNAVPTPVSFIEAPEIGAAKRVFAGPTANGDGSFSLSYLIVVENSGDVPLSNVQAIDDLNVTFAGATSFTVDNVFSTLLAENPGYDGSADTNLLTGADSMAPGATASIGVSVTVTPGANLGPFDNTASVSGNSPAGTAVSDVSTDGADPDPDNNGDPGNDSVPTPISFVESPQLGLAKAVSAGPVANGDGTSTLTYTITASNSGDVDVLGLQIVENLAVTFAAANSFTVGSVTSADFTVNAGFNGTTNTNLLTAVDTLPAAASGTVSITVTVTTGGNLGPYNNTATGNGTSPGGTPVNDDSTDGTDPDPDNNGDPGDNAAPTPVTFAETPGIGSAKSVSSGPDSNGDGSFSLVYSVVVENTGDVALNTVQVVENLSATFAGATGFVVDSVTSGSFAVNGSFNGIADTNLLSGADTLAPGMTGTVEIALTVTPGANLGPYNNSATASGMSPAGANLTDASEAGTMPDPDNDGDPGNNNTPTPVSFAEMPQIGAAKAVSTPPVSNGDGSFTLVYSIVVENSGDVPLSVVQVEDDLSATFAGAAGFTVDSVTSAGATVNPAYDGAADTNLLTGTLNLAPATSVSIDLTVTVVPGVNLGPYSNTAIASGNSPSGTPVSDNSTDGADPDPDADGNPGNNAVPTPLSFTEMPAIGAAKSVSMGPVNNGNGTHTMTYTITVENNGDAGLNSVQVVEDLAATFAGATGFVVDAFSSSTFTVNPAFDGSADTNLLAGTDTLAIGGMGTIVIDITITSGGNTGPYNNSVTASALSDGGTPVTDLSQAGTMPDPDNDGDPGNNNDPTSVTLVEMPQIGSAKAVTAGPVNNGDGSFTLTYTIVVENSGDVVLSVVQIEEDLALTFAGATQFVVDSVTSSDFTVNPAFDGDTDTNLLTGTGTINPGSTLAAEVTVTVTPGSNAGPYDNMAIATGTTPDGTPVSDESTDGPDPDPDNDGPGDDNVPTGVMLALGVDAMIDITDNSIPGDTLAITLNDADLNTDPNVAETVVVQVVNDTTGEVETITLTETGPDTGIFTGTVDTTFGTSAGTDNDGVFNSQIDDTITVTYNDMLNSTGGMTVLTDTDLVGNSPPVAVDDSASTPVDTPVAIPVLTNDADPNGHALTIVSIDMQPANGTVSFAPDGTLIYTPDPGFTGTDTFTYTISDGFGGTDTATVTIMVDNDSPTAVADSAVTPPATPVVIPVLANDTDPNNDPLTIVPGSLSDPANGSVTLNPDGTVTYTPDPGFTGTDTFMYTITDPDGNTDTAIVTVVVSDEIPQALDDVDATPLDTPITVNVLANDSDPGNDPLTVQSISQPGNGTATLNPDGTVTYTPNPGFIGVDTFTYTIVDPDGNTDIATVTITVGNAPPVAVDDSAATPIDTPVSIPVLTNDSDPDGHALTIIAIPMQPANGTVTFAPDGTLIYTPNPGFTGTDTFTYTIGDGFGGTDTATVTVVVDNDTPTAVADSAVTPPGAPVVIPVLANDTDPNNDPLTVVPGSLTNPANGTVTLNPDGTVTYTPNPGFTGTDNFTYTITDADGNMDTAIVTVIVSDEIPQALDDVDATPLNTPVTVNVLANDSDPGNDPLTVQSISQPGNGSATLNPDGTVTYTPNPGFIGVDTFTYTIVDADGNTDIATVTITVGNAPPVAVDDSAATPIDTPVSIPVLTNDSDTDGHALTIIAIPMQPANGTVTFAPDGTLIYTPNPGFTGTDTFTYTIGDGFGGTDTATVTVVVDNDTPTAVADSAVTPPATPVVIPVLANDTDPNNDPLTVVPGSLTTPANGTVTLNPDGTVTYTPNPGFTGTDNFTYTITDADGNTDSAIVTVVVSADIPRAVDDAGTTPLNTPVTVAILDNDIDPNNDPLSVIGISQPANGTAVLNPDGTVTYTPNAGFFGADTFTYTITDDDGNTDIATVTITVIALASVQGNVWLDSNINDAFDADEQPLEGWIIELVANGVVVATVNVAADGSYNITDVPVGVYDLVLRHPETNVAFGVLSGVNLPPGTTILDQNLAIDPSGVVYDSVSRQPLAGVVVTLTNGAGALLPAACLLPDQQTQTTGADGYYRFDVQFAADPACPSGGTYLIALVAPADYLPAPSTLLGPATGPFSPTGLGNPLQVQLQVTAPQMGDSTLYYLSFVLAGGDPDVINNHIPLDPLSGQALVRVTKRADRQQLRVGELVPYTITVENIGSAAVGGLTLSDNIPAGFSFVENSARLVGGGDNLVVTGQRPVQFAGIELLAGATATLRYVLRAGAGVVQGEYVNTVTPLISGQVVGNTATASVFIVPDPDFDETTIIGKVFNDINGNGWQDEGEIGLPGVRLATVEGLLVETDAHGRYHLAAVDGGQAERGRNFILKVDPASLPASSEFTTENPRVQRVTRGLMNRFDFGVRLPEQAGQCCEWIEVKLGEVFFRTGSAEISPQFVPMLSELADRLREYGGGMLRIEGNAADYETVIESTTFNEAQRYTLTPHFGIRKAQLREEDKAQLDRIIATWDGGADTHVVAVGHTDNVRIAPQNRHEYANNYALSEARALTVAQYVRHGLKLDPEQIEAIGRGPDQPVASNGTQSGRAANRRVELSITGSRTRQTAVTRPVGEAADLAQQRALAVYEALRKLLGDELMRDVHIETSNEVPLSDAANGAERGNLQETSMNRRDWRRPARKAAAVLASLLVGNAHAANLDDCTVDLCRTEDGFAIEIIGHKGQRQPAAGDTQAARMDQRRADVSARFLVRLPTGGMLWTTEDPAAMDPRLAVHAAETAALSAGALAQPVAFTVYSNYSAFIERAAVLIYDGSDIDRLRPIAEIPIPKGNYETVRWDGAGVRFAEDQQIHYLVRAWDSGGRMDETAMHSLRLVDASRHVQDADSAVTRSGSTTVAQAANAAALPMEGNVLVFRTPQETTSPRSQRYSLTPRFETRKVDLSLRDREELDRIIADWRGASGIRIVTVGHTDNIRIAPQNRREFANNQVLSEARARSIANYVAVALGVAPEAITAIGRGPGEPVASNATPAGRAANRRVELTISGNRVGFAQSGPAATVELVEPESNTSVAARTSLADAERALRARLGQGAAQGKTTAGSEREGATAVIAAQGASHTMNAVYGRNDLVRQNIPLYGSRVRLHGEDVGSSYGLLINGRGLPLDTNGRFAVEYLLPVGQHEFQVDLVDADGRINSRASVPVEVSGKHMFVVALADLTLSNNDISGSIEPLAQNDRFDDDFLVEGRLAFYLKGKIRGKYLVTAQMDSTEEQLSDILSNLSEKNPRDVFRRLDPDRYYPVYGDDSTTIDDTNSQGRLYLRADWDNSHAMWGNFHTGFTGTEFAQYNRSLYGARVGWRSLAATESGEAKTDATLFVSEAQTALGHSQFIGTGGSLYYLRHSDILPGSDKVHLEVRDRDSNRVRDNYTLQRGVDYEIDEIQGRIILSKPLMQIAPLLNPGLVKDAPLDGDLLLLMVDYEYIPDSFAEDHVTVGARATHAFGDKLEVGATYVDEGRGGGVGSEDYQMLGADVTLKLGEGTYVKAEMARTQASQTERFASNDGGLSFAQSAPPRAGREGDAYGVEARLNSREAFGTENEWVAGAWYRRVDDNFSIARRDDGIDVNEYGAELLGTAGEKIEIGARAAFVEREGDMDDEALSLQAKYAMTQRSTVSGEVRYVSQKDNQLVPAALGVTDASGSLAALKYSYALTPAVEVYGVGQFTLSNDSGRYDNNDMATVGTSVQLGERFDLAGEYSTGHRGDGALLSLDYNVNPNHEIYGTYTQSADRTDLRRPGSQIALGHRSRLSNQTSVFNERQFSEGEALSGVTHVFGLDFVPVAGWRIGFSLQNGDLETREGAIERDAGTVIVGFDGEAMRATSKVEYRDENGVSDRRQWLTANRLDYRISESLRMLTRFNWSETVDQRDRDGNAQFVEAGLGLAYRPVQNSRFNVLGKYTYLYDLPSLAQGLSATDQRSNIVTVEGLYQLTQRWEIGGKYGIRMGELRADRDNGEWFESTTSFAALRGRFHVIKAWDALLEYRWLEVEEANSTRTGWLAGIDRHFGDHLKLGIGYNFTDFSDDLTDLDYDHNGWFINALGKY